MKTQRRVFAFCSRNAPDMVCFWCLVVMCYFISKRKTDDGVFHLFIAGEMLSVVKVQCVALLYGRALGYRSEQSTGCTDHYCCAGF